MFYFLTLCYPLSRLFRWYICLRVIFGRLIYRSTRFIIFLYYRLRLVPFHRKRSFRLWHGDIYLYGFLGGGWVGLTPLPRVGWYPLVARPSPFLGSGRGLGIYPSLRVTLLDRGLSFGVFDILLTAPYGFLGGGFVGLPPEPTGWYPAFPPEVPEPPVPEGWYPCFSVLPDGIVPLFVVIDDSLVSFIKFQIQDFGR